MSNTQNGFTLVELMIVVAIVAILAAVGGNTYSRSVVKSNRVECQTALKGLASAMERFRSTNGTYATAHTGGVPNIYSGSCPIEGGATTYNIRVISADAVSYTLEAQAVGRQLSEGGGDMRLTSTNLKLWNKNFDTDFTDPGEDSWYD